MDKHQRRDGRTRAYHIDPRRRHCRVNNNTLARLGGSKEWFRASVLFSDQRRDIRLEPASSCTRDNERQYEQPDRCIPADNAGNCRNNHDDMSKYDHSYAPTNSLVTTPIGVSNVGATDRADICPNIITSEQDKNNCNQMPTKTDRM